MTIKWCPKESCGRILPEDYKEKTCPDCGTTLRPPTSPETELEEEPIYAS